MGSTEPRIQWVPVFFSGTTAAGASISQFNSIFSVSWLRMNEVAPLLLLYYFIGVDRLKFTFIFSRGSEIYSRQVTVLEILERPCRQDFCVYSVSSCSILIRLQYLKASVAQGSPCYILSMHHRVPFS